MRNALPIRLAAAAVLVFVPVAAPAVAQPSAQARAIGR